jgi:hypothetical protein
MASRAGDTRYSFAGRRAGKGPLVVSGHACCFVECLRIRRGPDTVTRDAACIVRRFEASPSREADGNEAGAMRALSRHCEGESPAGDSSDTAGDGRKLRAARHRSARAIDSHDAAEVSWGSSEEREDARLVLTLTCVDDRDVIGHHARPRLERGDRS